MVGKYRTKNCNDVKAGNCDRTYSNNNDNSNSNNNIQSENINNQKIATNRGIKSSLFALFRLLLAKDSNSNGHCHLYLHSYAVQVKNSANMPCLLFFVCIFSIALFRTKYLDQVPCEHGIARTHRCFVCISDDFFVPLRFESHRLTLIYD